MDHHEDAESPDDVPDPDDAGAVDHPDLNTPVLDEAFIAGATIHEPSASERLDGPGPYGPVGGTAGGGAISGFEPTRVFITTSRSDGPRAGNRFDEYDYLGPEDPGHPYDPVDDEDAELRRRSLRRRRRRGRTVKALALLVVLATFAVYGLDHFVTGIQLLPWTRMQRALSGNEPPAGDTAITPPGDDGTDDPSDASSDSEGTQEEIRIIRGENWPPAPENPSNERVLPGVRATTSGSHEFIMNQDDGSGPVAYDPCRTISYVVSGASKAPLEGRELLDEAIAEVSRVTGLAFVDEGMTTERPSEQRRAFQPHRYGARWAPVLIAWSDATESPRLAESPTEPGTTEIDILGYAGSNAVGLRTVHPGDTSSPADSGAGDIDRMIYVTGAVTLDGPDFASLLRTPGGREIARAAILHELAHLVGLAHVDDPTQLLYPSLQPHVTEFGGGDLEGLATLGSGRCMPEI